MIPLVSRSLTKLVLDSRKIFGGFHPALGTTVLHKKWISVRLTQLPTDSSYTLQPSRSAIRVPQTVRAFDSHTALKWIAKLFTDLFPAHRHPSAFQVLDVKGKPAGNNSFPQEDPMRTPWTCYCRQDYDDFCSGAYLM